MIPFWIRTEFAPGFWSSYNEFAWKKYKQSTFWQWFQVAHKFGVSYIFFLRLFGSYLWLREPALSKIWLTYNFFAGTIWWLSIMHLIADNASQYHCIDTTVTNINLYHKFIDGAYNRSQFWYRSHYNSSHINHHYIMDPMIQNPSNAHISSIYTKSISSLSIEIAGTAYYFPTSPQCDALVNVWYQQWENEHRSMH